MVFLSPGSASNQYLQVMRGTWDYREGLKGLFDGHKRATGLMEIFVLQGPHAVNTQASLTIRLPGQRLTAFGRVVPSWQQGGSQRVRSSETKRACYFQAGSFGDHDCREAVIGKAGAGWRQPPYGSQARSGFGSTAR